VSNLVLPPGKWVYEIHIVENNAGTDAYAVFGWSTPGFFGDCARGLGVGDDDHSIGLSGSFDDGLAIKYGAQVAERFRRGHTSTTSGAGNDHACFTQGDVITCAIDTVTGHVKFGKNGVWKSEAFVADHVNLAVGVTPAFSLRKGVKVEVNLGQIPRSDGMPGGAGMFDQMGLPEEGFLPIYTYITQGAPGEGAQPATIKRQDTVGSDKRQLVVEPVNQTSATLEHSASAPAVLITTEQQMALDACTELEQMLKSNANKFTNQAKKDLVVKRIAELRAIAQRPSRSHTA
jgi:hypothetical protein